MSSIQGTDSNNHTKEINKRWTTIPRHQTGKIFGLIDKVCACQGADGHKLRFGSLEARLDQKGTEVINYILVACTIPVHLNKTLETKLENKQS